MDEVQKLTVIIYGLFSAFCFLKSLHNTKDKNNSFGLAFLIYPIGGFVWADGVVFGLFWTIVSAFLLYLNSWILFLLTLSIFWLVRSVGETIYWFNQQFSSKNRNPIETLPFRQVFHNDSIWFVLQIYWQCVTVVTSITTIYLVHTWLSTLK
ncbi:MAG TPA: hypothetical protein VF185_01495 [Patescibacteria group bacterium]